MKLNLKEADLNNIEGKVINDRFLVNEEIIGRGGFASIYRGQDLENKNKYVALKVINKNEL